MLQLFLKFVKAFARNNPSAAGARGRLIDDEASKRTVGSVIRGIFKGIASVLLLAVLALVGINAWTVLSVKPHIESTPAAVAESGQAYDCIVVLGASVYADGTLSPILENRVDAAIELYNQGVAPIIVMSGDGRASNYDEPATMKEYAINQGVPADAIYCDPGGYHTYDTMWRVYNVFGAQSSVVVTQEYHLYRAVYDARGVGMDAIGAVSDTGTYENQLWYDVRECAGRVQDFFQVLTNAVPDNPYVDVEV